MCSSSWDACCNTAWNTAFPSGPPAKLGPFFPIARSIIWECHSPRSPSPTTWKSFVAALTDRDTEIHQNMFHHLSFLLLSSVNVMNNCCVCSELLCYSFRGFKWIFSWQHRQDYKCTGLGEKRVFPALKGGTQDHTRARIACAGESSVTVVPENRVQARTSFWPALEIQDIWSLKSIYFRPDPRPLNKQDYSIRPWLGLSGGKMPRDLPPLLLKWKWKVSFSMLLKMWSLDASIVNHL